MAGGPNQHKVKRIDKRRLAEDAPTGPRHLIPGDPRDYFPLKVAAFDLGSHMAVAHNLYGTGDVRVNHTEFKGTRVTRAAATKQWLHDLFDGMARIGPPDFVMYERPFGRGQDATRSLWGLAGLIEAEAGSRNIPVLDQDPSSIKKWTSGNGGAEKHDMLLFAAMTGYAGDNDHEADAYCLLRYAEANVAFERKRPPGKPRSAAIPRNAKGKFA